jgi:hypothetical protein
MLEPEAQWLESTIRRIGPERLTPLLNIGSGTEDFRNRRQPRAGRVLESLRRSGVMVINADLQPGPGVDVAGDLMDPRFIASLKQLSVRSVLCTNVLEHVADPLVLAASLSDLVPPGGYLILTVPHRYPYHADPIDNGYRPTPTEIVDVFKPLVPEDLAEIYCGTFLDGLRRDSRAAPLWLLRVLLPIYRPRGWLTAAAKLPFLFRTYSVSCVVLRKVGDSQDIRAPRGMDNDTAELAAKGVLRRPPGARGSARLGPLFRSAKAELAGFPRPYFQSDLT